VATTEAATAAVHCDGLVKVYRSATGETHALRGIDLVVRRGYVTVIAGPSGSGKSSLLRLLAARDRPSAGQLSVLGIDVVQATSRALRELRRQQIGFVAQRSSASLFPHLSARDQLLEVSSIRGGRLADADVSAALAVVGLQERAAHRPGMSSGGEQQRLAVAMALVSSPPLVVADEPTAELDHANADLVLTALTGAARAGTAVVVTSHDERVVRRADRVLRLRHGVLSSETERAGTAMTLIDSSGRLQLPQEALDLFPNGRAELRVADGAVTLTPPQDDP